MVNVCLHQIPKFTLHNTEYSHRRLLSDDYLFNDTEGWVLGCTSIRMMGGSDCVKL